MAAGIGSFSTIGDVDVRNRGTIDYSIAGMGVQFGRRLRIKQKRRLIWEISEQDRGHTGTHRETHKQSKRLVRFMSDPFCNL